MLLLRIILAILILIPLVNCVEYRDEPLHKTQEGLEDSISTVDEEEDVDSSTEFTSENFSEKDREQIAISNIQLYANKTCFEFSDEFYCYGKVLKDLLYFDSYKCNYLSYQDRQECQKNIKSTFLKSYTSIPVLLDYKNINRIESLTIGKKNFYLTDDSGEGWLLGLSEESLPLLTKKSYALKTYNKLGAGNFKIYPGSSHTCILEGGGVRCMGSNQHGELGFYPRDSWEKYSLSLFSDLVPGSGVEDIALGSNFSCFLQVGGVRCTGLAIFDEQNKIYESHISGFGHKFYRTHNLEWVPGLERGSGVKKIVATTSSVCAQKQNGVILCFGSLSSIRTKALKKTFEVKNLEGPVTSMCAGSTEVCSLEDGKIKCWGKDSLIDKGNSTIESEEVGGHLLKNFKTLSCGRKHFCALAEDEQLYCWGENNYGQLGVFDKTKQDIQRIPLENYLH